jgi:HEAT repeat protein
MFEDLELVLGQLADETRPVRSIDLARLSDLPRAEAMRFDAAWADLTAARRLETVRTMVERAEANIHLNFHAILRECLSDSDEQIRRLAVDGLWEDEKPSLIGRLVTLLTHDPIPDVRAAAATSLGRFVLLGVLGETTEAAAHQAEMALRAAWARAQQPNEVRRRALESLAYCTDPAVCDLIETAYNDDDGQMRRSAVFAMGRSADRRWSKPVLAELESRDPAMRFEATVSAGELGLVAAVQRLVQLMDDVDSSISEAAALALGKIGGRAAKRALEEVLRGSDERLTQAAEEALEELTFNSFDFEERLGDRDEGSRRRRTGEADEMEDEDFFDEDEDDTGLSQDALQEDEDSWDEAEDDPLYWLNEDEEDEDEYLDGPDLFPGPAGRPVPGPGRDRGRPPSPSA